jgi:hypothetical protein
MKNIYNESKSEKAVRGPLRISAIVIMVMVWILIDKGNIYGQSISDRDVISKSDVAHGIQSAQLRERADEEGGELPIEDKGGEFVARPNPVIGELVFDFEFTVKTGIPFEVLDPLGRLAAQGTFEPGVSSQSIDLSHLKTGMYLVRLDLGDKMEVRRIIKK